MQRIIVLGAGFAGLWSAIGAARALGERGIGPDQVQVTVVNATRWHCIRVRNYEADLSDARVRYLYANGESLVNYNHARIAGQRVSTAHLESTVNQLVTWRMCKKQQMR
jgi:NADH dehydrogenase FAD-containing subunit